MKKYLNSVVAKFDTTQSGNAATGTTITVRVNGTGAKAAIYSDNGSTAKENPFTVDSNANYEFYAPNGRYNVIQDEGLVTELSLTDVSIFDVDSFLVNEGVSVEAFGFSSSNTGAENLAALTEAYNSIPDGGTILINQESDFVCDRLEIINAKSFNIKLNNAGKWDARNSGSCLGIVNEFENILSVTAIDALTYNFQGSPTTVDRLEVSNATAYSKGDIVKVASNTNDPWDARGNRKLAEFAEVAGTDLGYIYLTSRLEETYDLGANVRVARMPKRTIGIDIDVISDEGNENVLVQLEAMYKPNVRVNVENHGRIVCNLKSCYRGDFYGIGSGYTNETGALGYYFNDSGGFCNTYHQPFGKFFRHIVTSNASAVSNDSADIAEFGPTRGMTVLGGVAVGCQGAPWDDHDGARRSQFINCKSLMASRTSAASPCAVQVRGRDTRIINCEVIGPAQTISTTYALVRFGTGATGTIQIETPTCISEKGGSLAFINPPTANDIEKPTVVVNGGNIRLTDEQAAVNSDNMNLHMCGTNIYMQLIDNDFVQVFSVTNGKAFINGVSVKMEGTALNARVARLNGNAKIAGQVTFESFGIDFQGGVRSDGAGNSSYFEIINTETIAGGSLNDSGIFDFANNTIVNM
tara:strand:- start:34090 stop:36003 length:1914 start_codon:yes stop_codon:yes gene_type:complete